MQNVVLLSWSCRVPLVITEGFCHQYSTRPAYWSLWSGLSLCSRLFGLTFCVSGTSRLTHSDHFSIVCLSHHTCRSRGHLFLGKLYFIAVFIKLQRKLRGKILLYKFTTITELRYPAVYYIKKNMLTYSGVVKITSQTHACKPAHTHEWMLAHTYTRRHARTHTLTQLTIDPMNTCK